MDASKRTGEQLTKQCVNAIWHDPKICVITICINWLKFDQKSWKLRFGQNHFERFYCVRVKLIECLFASCNTYISLSFEFPFYCGYRLIKFRVPALALTPIPCMLKKCFGTECTIVLIISIPAVITHILRIISFCVGVIHFDIELFPSTKF